MQVITETLGVYVVFHDVDDDFKDWCSNNEIRIDNLPALSIKLVVVPSSVETLFLIIWADKIQRVSIEDWHSDYVPSLEYARRYMDAIT